MRLDHLLSEISRHGGSRAATPFLPVLPFPHIPLADLLIGERETRTWGYSSVARAVALQAIGLGFKSPYLQRTRSLTVQGKGEESARSLLPERQVTRERRERPWWPGA